jgi:hypothetical protein
MRHAPVNYSFDITDEHGNLIEQDIDFRGDIYSDGEGDSLGSLTFESIEIQPDYRWVALPEHMKPAFERWLNLADTRERVAEWLDANRADEGWVA